MCIYVYMQVYVSYVCRYIYAYRFGLVVGTELV